MFGLKGRPPTHRNVRAMQLFHELKQRHPSMPDHIASSTAAAITMHKEVEDVPVEVEPEPEPEQVQQVQIPDNSPPPNHEHEQYEFNAKKPPRSPSSNNKTVSERKCSSASLELQVTPPTPATTSPLLGMNSNRSFTSVNLTLRPPTNEPQAPIDITSRNASLTYSTSSFDRQRGTESRLQITVSPTGGSVSSYRRQRPHSCHFDLQQQQQQASSTAVPCRNISTSLQDLTSSPVLMKQQAKLDRLKIELTSERSKLIAMQQEVLRLDTDSCAVDSQLEEQLLKEILHLRGQCERLTIEVDQQTDQQQQQQQEEERDAEFYRNIYVGQRHPANFGRPLLRRRLLHRDEEGDFDDDANSSGQEAAYWNCPKCTFQNHPLLAKCEQCDMAHIVHGTLTLNGNAIQQKYCENSV